jgi:hypothetical protein
MTTKPGIRDSLVNMLGEFVGLSKNPEFRLSTSSEQFLADAIKEEKKASTCSFTSSQGSVVNIYIGMDPISHQRSNSTPIRRNYPAKTDSEESRRLSVPLLRPKLLLKRFKRNSGSYDPNPSSSNNTNVISTPRQNSIISESDEEVLNELPKPKRTRNYSQSSSILGDLANTGHVRCQPLMLSIH